MQGKCREMVGQKKTGPSGRFFFSKCAEVADMFAAGHSLAPVAMMLVAGETRTAREWTDRGRLAAWLNKMS